tara:strand:+ start:1297 stop:1827 length:531 start_codon:yes stop_codon:yes gene_type:complete
MITKNLKFLFSISLLLIFVSCSGLDIKRHETDIRAEKDAAKDIKRSNAGGSGGLLTDLVDDLLPESGGTVFGFGGSISFGAALTKINFMPLASVDSNSGIIITEWYNIKNDETRIKINIQVLNDEMTDNSITVQLFEQKFDGSKWVDQGNDTVTADKIKFSILEEARLLKTTADLS